MTIIPAATTPTANTNTEPTEINSVQDLLEQLKCIHEYPQQADLRYWFRGQPNSAHLLLPGVYRKKFVPGAAPSKTTPDPLPHERLTKERLMSKEFAIRSASMVDKKLEDVELYFLQQHYGMPTRLLDWTANPLVGLFFATKSSTEKFAVDCPGIDQALFREDETDGKLFSVDANGFQANPFAAEVNFRGTASKRNPLLREAIKHVFDWGGGDTKFPNFIFPVVPDGSVIN